MKSTTVVYLSLTLIMMFTILAIYSCNYGSCYSGPGITLACKRPHTGRWYGASELLEQRLRGTVSQGLGGCRGKGCSVEVEGIRVEKVGFGTIIIAATA